MTRNLIVILLVAVVPGNLFYFQGTKKVEGYSPNAQKIVHTGDEHLEDFRRRFDEWLNEFQRDIKEFRESERGRRLEEKMQKLMEEARIKAKRNIEEFRNEISRFKEELNRNIEEFRKPRREKEGEDLKEV